jgi:hypothetical protein
MVVKPDRPEVDIMFPHGSPAVVNQERHRITTIVRDHYRSALLYHKRWANASFLTHTISPL